MSEPIPQLPIHVVRDQRVLLDADLASLYGVPTKRLNEQVRRNLERFPKDFCFQLTPEEWQILKSQIAMSNLEAVENKKVKNMRSQFATASKRNVRYFPYVFTEHGALQAANVLNSKKAVHMSLYVIRAFVKMREELTANATILKRLAEIDKTLFLHDSALRDLYQKLLPLLSPPPEKPRPQIGFHQNK